jgi:hydrogenase/urease accessory protein HupE
MVRLHTLAGETRTYILGPEETVWRFPRPETADSVALQYTALGVEHVLSGWDHLLFLLCLLWIAGSFRRVLITVTGFTIAHSITLGLSALQIIRVPVPPVEAAIALSIVFLAREIVVGRRNSWTWNYPVAVSSSFGLLHGLGFAAALGELGLPQTQLLTGLLFFNVGVEIGQLMFIGGALAAFWLATHLVRRVPTKWIPAFVTPKNAHLAAAYSVGVVAAYWLLERVLGFLNG